MSTLDLGVLVSGRGSNLQAILDAIRDGRLDARVRVVISNQPKAVALERAAEHGAPTSCISHRDYSSREAFDEALVEKLREADVEWVVLAGFMRVLTSTFVRAFPHRIVNIHPALLPSFPGTHAHQQALDYGVKITGCTVHLIDEGVDTGPIIAQQAVPILEGDDETALAARVLVEEHRLLVEVLKDVAAGKVRVVSGDDGGRAHVVRG